MTEAWEEQMATDHEPAPGDWVVQVVEEIPGYTVYDVNNGVGRVVGYGDVMAKIAALNPEERAIWLLDNDGEYRPW